jgi:DNA polymerase elongation subunit (family B)
MNNNKKTNILEYQLYDWLESCEETDDENEVGDYIIHSFGRCNDGKSVYAKIINYTPYFYILLPNRLQNKEIYFLKKIKHNLDYKLKNDVYINKKFISTLLELKLKQLKCADNFTNNTTSWFIKLVFSSYEGMKKYRYYLENNDLYIDGIKEKLKLYEANLPPMLRCFHINKISGCSWIQTNKYNLITENKVSRCDIEIIVDWKNLIPIKKDYNAPFRICSFDIECYSGDGSFPQATRKSDQIIQIGATYTYIGESIPYRQYIACLDKTSQLKNIIVESCDTEQDLILNFLDEINNNDCDILTGHNIFFFDEKYIYDRCKYILNLETEISYMSKLKYHKCNFKEMKLASSALSENLFRFWETPGRIHIDFMKDVQKTFTNLSCFKLDYLASYFIRGQILNYNKLDNNKYELKCKTINDICVGDYIHLEVSKGFVSDEIGKKYLVIDVNNDIITINGYDNLYNELYEASTDGILYWSQAKDDVGPKEIFKLQKGTPDDRAIIAKYCIKDCKLVNLLINKLEVVTKNIEMANVCYVPLGYLFIRGQGIKLFSLCLKEFKEHNYAFPVIKVPKKYGCMKCKNEFYNEFKCPKCKSYNKIEIELEITSYEGAIVFNPVPKVEYEALATKDYMSLYPASIIHKNMSHETLVENTKYDNIPGIKYYDAQYKEADGSIQYRRFAQINNELGVIPTILSNLLKERKLIKKQMKQEKDPFKIRILDAKQLAVKITANSLYGQLGATTSPICKRDIAACTTSTGREMLILAKKYDEECLPWIINALKYFYKTKQYDKIEHLYDLELKDRYNSDIINKIENFVCNDIKNLIFQPVIRYGDTDSIFSCYRFRENTILTNEITALNTFKQIIQFGYTLIEPYFNTNERKIFKKVFDKYYSENKITKLELPPSPSTPHIITNNIILNLNDRMKIFIKEYMEESYFPWLWTLTELVENNDTNMFDIKLCNWAEHLVNKINLIPNNLQENRKNYLINQVVNDLNNIFNYKYTIPTKETIELFTNKFNKDNSNCYQFVNEINIPFNKITTLIKNLMEKTIKDKWIYSGEKKEILNIIDKYLNNVIDGNISNKNKLHYYITEFINNNKNLDLNVLTDLLIKNLLSNNELDVVFNENNMLVYTLKFITDYTKNIGKKTMEEIIIEFMEKNLELNFNLYKEQHYNNVINFIKSHMCCPDTTQMEENKYVYYYMQPRWDFDENKNKIYKVDIYEGGKSITDKRTLEHTINMGIISGETIKSRLPFPHDCEYEKTFWPFAILTKKRYVGNKYEFDVNKYKQDFMGIVLKRRDNAPIVKEICGGIINELISKSPENAKIYTKKCIQDMFDGKYDIRYFITSKTLKLKESYKDWSKIAHVYLAEKIKIREPGNIPQSGDRIEFVTIKVPPPKKGVKLLQGDIIETPKFIKENNLEIDYMFYLTNQIMNPALQFLELVDKNAKNIFQEFIDKYSIYNFDKKKIIKKINILIKTINVKINKLNKKNKKFYSNINKIKKILI